MIKSFIIHLPSIPASLETATIMLEKFKEFNMPAELFEGTIGPNAVKKFEQQGRTQYLKSLKGNPIKPGGKEGSPGVQGCFDSHYRLWQKCVDLKEPIIIWEDDIILSRPFTSVEWEDVLIVALGHPTKSVRWMHLLNASQGEPQALNYKSPSMPGCCGYAIKPHAAKKLLDMYATTFRPADNAINRNIVKMQIHSHIMGIAKVDGKKSLTKSSGWAKGTL